MKKWMKYVACTLLAVVLFGSCHQDSAIGLLDHQTEITIPNYSGGFVVDKDDPFVGTIIIGANDTNWKDKFPYHHAYVFEADPKNPYYASYDGALYTKDYTKLLKVCEHRTGIEFPPSLQTIEDGGFGSWTYNRRVVIPWGVTAIGSNFDLHTHGNVIIPDTLTDISKCGSKYMKHGYIVASINNIEARKMSMEIYTEVPSMAGLSSRPWTPLYKGENLDDWNFYECYGITPNTLKTFQNGKTYYFDKDCKMAKGWKQASGNWYYFNDYGAAVVKCWKQSGGKWFYMQADGTMAKNKWVEWYKKWYYVGADGAMYANRKTPDGYWVNGSGVWVK